MFNWKHFRKLVFSYRIILGLFTWSVLILMFVRTAKTQVDVLSGFLAGIRSYRYYTMQTNLLVAIWLTLAVIFHFNSNRLKKVEGALKGGITIYITITFLGYAIMLSSLYNPTTPYGIFTNLVIHYLVPIAFLIDWIFTLKKVKYKFLYLAFWIIYPILYIIWSVINGKFLGSYLYPFLDIDALGLGYYFLALGVLVVVFLGLGSLLILINRLVYRSVEIAQEPKIFNEKEQESS